MGKPKSLWFSICIPGLFLPYTKSGWIVILNHYCYSHKITAYALVRLLASARFKSLCLFSLDHQGIGCHLCLISWEWLWLLHLCLILHYDMSNYSSPNLYTQSHTTRKEWIHLTPKQIFFHYIILHSDILYLNTIFCCYYFLVGEKRQYVKLLNKSLSKGQDLFMHLIIHCHISSYPNSNPELSIIMPFFSWKKRVAKTYM